MNLIEAKKALRSEVRAAERTLPPRYREESNAGINARLLALPEFQLSQTVFAFVGTAREIDTTEFLTATLRQGKRLCVPLCTGPGIMELRKISKSFDHSTIIPSLHLLVLHIKALPQFFSKNLIITIKGTNIGKLVTKGNDLSVSWCMVL